MSTERKQQILAALAERRVEFHKEEVLCDQGKPHEPSARTGVGIALELTVRLLAPELFEDVLAVVQGRA